MVGKNILEHPDINRFEILYPSRAELDLLEYNKVVDYIRLYRPHVVIHAAGKVGGIQANIKEPTKFLADNLIIGKNVVLAARNCGVAQLINLGSSCMYPKEANNPLKEEYILTGELEPTNEGYALAKITTAKLCEYISKETPEFQYKTIIPCNLYGRWDKFDPSNAHMIPAVIAKIHDAKVKGLHEVEIWGNGLSSREFMFASDLADFILYSLSNFEKTPYIVNCGLGYDFTINEYYKIISEIIGYKGQFYHNLERPTGMHKKVVDITKQLEFGWEAKTSLVQGVQQAYQFYLDQFQT